MSYQTENKNQARCSTCRHWDTEHGWDGKEDGMCERLGGNKYIVADTWFKMFITFGGDGNPHSVHTGANFGCVFHEIIKPESDV